MSQMQDREKMRLTDEQVKEIQDQMDSAKEEVAGFVNGQVNGNTFGRCVAMAEFMRLMGESLIVDMKESMNPEVVTAVQNMVRDCYDTKISHEHQSGGDDDTE